MRRMGIILAVLVAYLPWQDFPSTRGYAPSARPSAAVGNVPPHNLIPAPALLALEAFQMEMRYEQEAVRLHGRARLGSNRLQMAG